MELTHSTCTETSFFTVLNTKLEDLLVKYAVYIYQSSFTTIDVRSSDKD